jgi:hypothetical protein
MPRCWKPGSAGRYQEKSGRLSRGPVIQREELGDRFGQVGAVRLGDLLEERLSLVEARVQPLVADVVAPQELPDGVAPRRIPLSHDPYSRSVAVTGALPPVEEVRDDWKQIPLAIERLDQEVVQPHRVDGVDRELEVGVPAQQHRRASG